MKRSLQVFGYLNEYNNRRIFVDQNNPKTQGGGIEINKDLTKELNNEYTYYSENIDSNLPDPLFDEMDITVFVNYEHAHNKLTIIPITGIIIFVDRTPVFYSRKIQG